jgi:ligand-binding sensor domain-containing protein
LRSSSTSPEGTAHRGAIWLLAAAICLVPATDALALDPERAPSQYIRTDWGSERGFPGGPVYALTQTNDGYLWIGTEKGLVRFDGLTFRLFDSSALTANAGPAVFGVAAAADGSLWARLRGAALVRLHDGVFDNLLGVPGVPVSVVTAMLRERDDGMLLATMAHGAVAYRNGQFTTVAAAGTIPTSSFIISIARSADGDIWLGTRDAGLLRVQGPGVTRIVHGLPDLKINSLLPGEGGDLWIGTDKGVVKWTGSAISGAGIPAAVHDVPVLAMIRDRDANVWVAAGSRGLMRINSRGVATFGDVAPRGGDATALFEDRDGNIWVGTTKGIERIRDGVFTSYSAAQGLPSDGMGPVHVDAAARTWFAPADGGLYWLRDGQIRGVTQAGLRDDIVYSIAGDGADVWIGRQRGGLTRLHPQAGGTFEADHFTQADGLAQNSVYAVHQAHDRAVWAGTLSGGVSRFKDGQFTTYTTANGLAANTVSAILEGRDGTMWFGTPNGVSALSRGGWRRYAVGDGLPSNDVNTLFEDSDGVVWVGTAGGLAFLRADKFQKPANLPPRLRGSVVALAEDHTGWLWVATADHLFCVQRDALTDRPFGEAALREYSLADGLLAVEGVKRHRSVVADARGRIWIATNRGLSMADPVRGEGRAVPALTHVEEVSADGRSIDRRGFLRIPAGGRRITLTYAGLSLAVPERVMFRYRLDGFDRDWSEPGTMRQAVYTNLNPGSYVFRVIASNAYGVWNGAEAVQPFQIQPSIWQTAWFQTSVGVFCVCAAWGAYRLRVFHVSRQLNKRFEERLAERTRIAQELHDTLLQGFISASMQLHVVADCLPVDSPAHSSLTRVLDLIGRVIEEGRNAVRGLRSSTRAAHDLEEAFSGIRQEVAGAEHTSYRVIVEGEARPLNATIRDEVYRIGREALVNAFRHSGARSIELELEYASATLRMLVRDDGCGIDPRVVRAGTDGHWGLVGMRERARSIGAGFKVMSRAEAGTEVELTVPGSVAFEREPGTRPGLITGFYRRMIGARDPGPTEKES